MLFEHKARTARRSQAIALSATLLLATALLHALPVRAQQEQRANDWQARLRKQVAAHQLTAALEIADRRIAVAPQDTDARGWRARILGWLGRLQEAEAEFRSVLQETPRDPDVLGGLAWVLAREQRKQEALALLNRAIAIDPARADLREQRMVLLRSMGSPKNISLAGNSPQPGPAGMVEAYSNQDSPPAVPHHELRVGSDTDAFNYTGAANAETLELISRWNPVWTTSFSGIFYQRFGEDARKFSGTVWLRLGKNDSFDFGGAVARDQGVIPRSEAFFEYGHGFRLSRSGFIRGLETDFGSHWYWYRDARVLTLTGTATLYLPRDWRLRVTVTPARSVFSGTGADWKTSGISKLILPLHRRISANFFFAAGTEDFAVADQIGSFSSRTFGAGATYRVATQQDISFYALRQNRSQGRTQTSFGVSYGFYF